MEPAVLGCLEYGPRANSLRNHPNKKSKTGEQSMQKGQIFKTFIVQNNEDYGEHCFELWKKKEIMQLAYAPILHLHPLPGSYHQPVEQFLTGFGGTKKTQGNLNRM